MVEERTAAGAAPRSDGPVPEAQVATLALLFDALPDGAWVTDAAGVVIYMNPAARILLELAPDAAPADAAARFAELRDAAGQPLAPDSQPLPRAPTDLVALVEEVVEHHRREARRHQFVLEKPEEPLLGDWDAALLERAIENLVGNAVKYSPQGGQVTVTCADDGERVRLSVR